MRASFSRLRGVALSALLCGAAACGDDETSDDNDQPRPDAGDAAVDIDAGDAGALPDAGDAALPRDASTMDGGDAATELEQALDPTGVRPDMRRAELVIAAFCRAYGPCLLPPSDAGVDAGTDLSECVTSLLDVWGDAVDAGDSPACLDAVLDTSACLSRGGTCMEAVMRCETFTSERERICMMQR